ncbi:hypothetical protein [Streptomyces sp. SID10362]|uniref:hypothetical protein n=1 Tax=Streptomyces sp. SID10362 TaxID=2706021 RepID=UPI00197F948B|nr:hypothetical protein [Streptomyces sp. SID10362]
MQHPALRGGEDRLFLSDDPVPGSPFLLRHTAAGWEVNSGQAHGLRAAGAEFALLDGGGTPRAVVVREVRVESVGGWSTRTVRSRRDHCGAPRRATPHAADAPPAGRHRTEAVAVSCSRRAARVR